MRILDATAKVGGASAASPSSTLVAAKSEPLLLRREEPVSIGFGLQTAIVLLILLAGATLALKWLAKKLPAMRAAQHPVMDGAPKVLGKVNVSAKTRVSLIEVGGYRALVTEAGHSAVLTLLPVVEQAPGPPVAEGRGPALVQTQDETLPETH